MNSLVKKAAVKRYASLLAEGKSEEEIKAAIAEDAKKFSPADVDEIYEAVVAEANDTEDEEDAPKGGYNIVDEYLVKWDKDAKDKSFENAKKLDLRRKGIKLTDEALEQNNARCNELHPIAYFKQ